MSSMPHKSVFLNLFGNFRAVDPKLPWFPFGAPTDPDLLSDHLGVP